MQWYPMVLVKIEKVSGSQSLCYNVVTAVVPNRFGSKWLVIVKSLSESFPTVLLQLLSK